MTINEKKELRLANLVSIRRKMSQRELAEEVQNNSIVNEGNRADIAVYVGINPNVL